MKKALLFFLAFAVFATVFNALGVVSLASQSGTCGADLAWTLESGTLTVSGSGKMANYDMNKSAPWKDYAADITEIVIGEGVTTIGRYAFINCAATEVIIPDGVDRIFPYAFADCKQLNSVYIPYSVSAINENAFDGCVSLTDVYYNASKENWKNVEVGNNNNYLKNAEFHYEYTDFIHKGECGEGLTWVLDKNYILTVSGSGVMDDYMQDSPWYKYTLDIKGAVVEDGVKNIGNLAFWGFIGATEATLAQSVETIGQYAFVQWRFKELALPENLTSIGDYAFSNCQKLESITVPVSLAEIGEGAFQSCFELTDVYYEGSRADWAKIAIAHGNSYLLDANIHFNEASIARTVQTEDAVTVTLENPKDGERLTVAVFTESGGLCAIKSVITDAETSAYSFDIDVSSGAFAKAMLWDSYEDMQPIDFAVID